MSLPPFVLVGARIVVAGKGPGMICMDNEDGTWNVDLDDGTEVDAATADLSEEPPLKEVPSGVRIITDWEKEPKPEGWCRVVCFSDTHGMHDKIPQRHCPEGDILLHAGDFSNTGEVEQIQSLSAWLGAYPAQHKVVIAGNHDITFHEEYYQARGAKRFHSQTPYDCKVARASLSNCTYLEDSAVEVCGYRIYGSPWQPEFCDWAFNLKPGPESRKKWEPIPESVDILMTHGPAKGFLDNTSTGVRVGCGNLLEAIQKRAVSVSVVGHIHEGYGCATDGATLYVNASTCTHDYRPTNRPIVFDLPPPAQLREATQKVAETRR